MDTITTLGSFAIVGVLGSLVIEYTKNIFTTATQGKRITYMLVISLVGGLVVYFFHLIPANFVTDFVGIVAAVNTAYLFLVQFLPNWNPLTPVTTTA